MNLKVDRRALAKAGPRDPLSRKARHVEEVADIPLVHGINATRTAHPGPKDP